MNDKPVCEQAHLCEFRVVLAVEPPALAGKNNGMGKSEPADQFFFFTPRAVSRCYPIGTKQNVNKNDRKLHKEIFAADSKIQSL